MERIDATQLRVKLRHAVATAGGMRAWAREADVSAQYVSDVLLEKCQPGESIARALGYVKAPVAFVPAP